MDELDRRQVSELRRTGVPRPLLFVRRLIWSLLGIVEVLLGLRFLLALFGANPDAGFTNFINTVTDPLVSPFQAVFSNPAVSEGVLEIGTLLAMVVYGLAAWGLVALLNAIFSAFPQSTVETAGRYDLEDRYGDLSQELHEPLDTSSADTSHQDYRDTTNRDTTIYPEAAPPTSARTEQPEAPSASQGEGLDSTEPTKVIERHKR